jgi:hypothetical protein
MIEGIMGKPPKKDLDQTKALMGALVRMKPKPHEELKGRKTKKSATRKRSAPKASRVSKS